jgi:hypothetical protein
MGIRKGKLAELTQSVEGYVKNIDVSGKNTTITLEDEQGVNERKVKKLTFKQPHAIRAGDHIRAYFICANVNLPKHLLISDVSYTVRPPKETENAERIEVLYDHIPRAVYSGKDRTDLDVDIVDER